MKTDPTAPFYGLVLLVDEEIRAGYRRADANRRKPHGRPDHDGTRRRIALAAAALLALTACSPREIAAWVSWHEQDPDAAVEFAQRPEVVADLATGEHETDGPQFQQYLESRGGCDGIYDEMRRQGASDGVAQRFAYRIAPRESGCSAQYVHDRDDWSYSRFGLNGLTAGLRRNWAAWCGADVRSDTAHLPTDVRCALAAHARMGWSPWS